jgi:hypothetical protein
MALPTILFGFITAILLGSGFHLWRGGPVKQLLLYLLVSIIGFWLAQLVALLWQMKFLPVGALQYGFDVMGSLCFLFLAFVLSNNPSQDERNKKR